MTKTLLCLASISCLWVCCGQTNAQAKRLEPEVGKLPREVVGYGETEAKAEATALLLAARAVNDLMAIQKPPMNKFVVDVEYAREHLVDIGYGGEAEKDLIIDNANKTWTLPFRTDTDWWGDVVRRDNAAQRGARSIDRQTWTSRGMFGIAMLLLAAVGYSRIDEYTHRRYTTWLRVASIGVVTTVVIGWVYLFRAGW